MPHTICTADRREELSYFRRLWERLLASELDMGTKLEWVFKAETDEFGLDYAFLTRIDREDETKRFELVHDPDGRIDSNETVPLACTYCRKTIAAPEGTLAVSDALAEGWDGDPAYERFGFRSYLGTTVTVEGELYGTLCFADTDRRDERIAEEEATLVRMLGQWVTYELNQWTDPPMYETTSHNLGELSPLRSPEIDSIMDALAKRPRRRILLALLDDSVADGLPLTERATDFETSEVELLHVHAPKLAEAGYVEWDRDENRASRGPNFTEIEPFLRLLKEYAAECST